MVSTSPPNPLRIASIKGGGLKWEGGFSMLQLLGG